MESKDRHITVHCKFCDKSMRSDNLKRHMKIQQSLFTMSDEEIKEMIKARHENQLKRDRTNAASRKDCTKHGICT